MDFPCYLKFQFFKKLNIKDKKLKLKYPCKILFNTILLIMKPSFIDDNYSPYKLKIINVLEHHIIEDELKQNYEKSFIDCTKYKIDMVKLNEINLVLENIIRSNQTEFQSSVYIQGLFKLLDVYPDCYLYTLETITLALTYIQCISRIVNIINYQLYFLVCLCIANKMLEDKPYNNKAYVVAYFDKDYNPYNKLNYKTFFTNKLKIFNKIEIRILKELKII